MTANLHTTTAETLVAGDPSTVFAAVTQLVDDLWPAMTEVVLSDPCRRLLHTVSGDGADIDGWLTWELDEVASESWTSVRLVHDEADTSGGPPPELDAVLALLRERVGRIAPTGGSGA